MIHFCRTCACAYVCKGVITHGINQGIVVRQHLPKWSNQMRESPNNYFLSFICANAFSIICLGTPLHGFCSNVYINDDIFCFTGKKYGAMLKFNICKIAATIFLAIPRWGEQMGKHLFLFYFNDILRDKNSKCPKNCVF